MTNDELKNNGSNPTDDIGIQNADVSAANSLAANRSFAQLIQNDFLRRRRINPRYSLRGYSKLLGIDPSQMSKILRGKLEPSTRLMASIGPSLGLRPKDIEKHQRAIEELYDTKKQVKPPEPNLDYAQINDDYFSVMSDWYHFAILELIKTEDFQTDHTWIAKRLSIHSTEVKLAMDRLLRLGFIQVSDGTIRISSPHHSWTNHDFTTHARKQLQKQLTEKSLSAIDEIPFDLRDSGSLTVACPKNLLPEVRKRIHQFRRELDAFIENSGSADAVYQLLVSFYPLTREGLGALSVNDTTSILKTKTLIKNKRRTTNEK